MKRKYFLSFLLLIVVILVSGCSAFGTKLTGENINDYLSIKVGVSAGPDNKHIYTSKQINGEDDLVYTYLDLKASVRGVSENFNYNDVKLKMKITLDCKGFNYPDCNEVIERTFEEEVDFDTNISGDAQTFTKQYEFDDFVTNKDLTDIHVEITDISGNVTKAK